MAAALILDIVRTALRRTSTSLDDNELKPLIAAAKSDLMSAGIDVDDTDALIQAAIRMYVLATIERDDKEWAFYDRMKAQISIDSRYRNA